MTQIAFHHGAVDGLDYVCRLLRKAVSTGVRVVVMAPLNQIGKLDEALWALSPTDFITHCEVSAPSRLQQRCAVVFVPTPKNSLSEIDFPKQVLVNLGEEIPDGFADFQRVIEVVSNDEKDRLAARSRWKQYVSMGYELQRHDLGSKGGN